MTASRPATPSEVRALNAQIAKEAAAARAARALLLRKATALTALSAGVVASISANYLAADGGLVSRAIAVWPALALVITVHLFQHSGKDWKVKLAVAPVVAVAAWMSYWHMVEVVSVSETVLTAHIFPLSVDGMIYVASAVLARKPAPAATRSAAPRVRKAASSKAKATAEAAAGSGKVRALKVV